MTTILEAIRRTEAAIRKPDQPTAVRAVPMPMFPAPTLPYVVKPYTPMPGWWEVVRVSDGYTPQTCQGRAEADAECDRRNARAMRRSEHEAPRPHQRRAWEAVRAEQARRAEAQASALESHEVESDR